MKKFSVIVPVYNTSKYLEKCIKSLINQTFKNYEVIIINDGSTDNSEEILTLYANKYNFIKLFSKKNGGLSDARNFGVEKCTGEYIVFLDSDDYFEENTLEIINEKLTDEDIFGYGISYVDTNEQIIKTVCFEQMFKITGVDALEKLIDEKKLFEAAGLYAYKTSFFKKNNFKYELNKFHEDFGLTPYILFKANFVSFIPNCLYNYVQSDNSITRNDNYDITKKRVYDILFHYDNLHKLFMKSDMDINFRKKINAFLANVIINNAKKLNKRDLLHYLHELKERNVSSELLDDTFVRKLKKKIIKIDIRLYLKFGR